MACADKFSSTGERSFLSDYYLDPTSFPSVYILFCILYLTNIYTYVFVGDPKVSLT